MGTSFFICGLKGELTNRLKKNKIAYSGIFKEKVNIYRELLEKTYGIKKELNRFQYVGTKEEGNEIMQKINDYIQFYSINQPFLSDEMLSDLNKIHAEFQDVFDKFYMHISNTKSDIFTEFIEAGNKLKTNNPFSEIEKRIIAEMRNDLKIAEFGK